MNVLMTPLKDAKQLVGPPHLPQDVPRAPAPARTEPPPGMTVTVAQSADELEEHVAAWQDLAAAAVEPNVFYEPWMLMPALRSFGRAARLRFVLIYRPHPTNPNAAPTLCGLFPLEWRRNYMGLPVATLRNWSHPYCLLTTPLLRAGAARQSLEALFQWLATDRRSAGILELTQISADGPFYHELASYLHDNLRRFLVGDCWVRALFRRGANAESYLKAALSASQRKALRRKSKRLSEEGPVAYRLLQDERELDTWLAEFLRVEASGWKGQEGTAIACRPTDRAFFETTARAAFRLGKLRMLALLLNNKPIAYQCYFEAGPAAFAFKTAYDEVYSRFSPGALIQLELIEGFHQQPGVQWMDSGSDPDSYLNSIWPDRRIMQNLLIPTGKGMGGFVVSLLPMLRWIKDGLFGKRVPPRAATPQGES